jgi:hypothetical protein
VRAIGGKVNRAVGSRHFHVDTGCRGIEAFRVRFRTGKLAAQTAGAFLGSDLDSIQSHAGSRLYGWSSDFHFAEKKGSSLPVKADHGYVFNTKSKSKQPARGAL